MPLLGLLAGWRCHVQAQAKSIAPLFRVAVISTRLPVPCDWQPFSFDPLEWPMTNRFLLSALFIILVSLPATARTSSDHAPTQAPQPPADTNKGKAALCALTCWQHGQKIIDEHGLSAFSYGPNSFSATLPDGETLYVSGLDQATGTVCKVIEYHR